MGAFLDHPVVFEVGIQLLLLDVDGQVLHENPSLLVLQVLLDLILFVSSLYLLNEGFLHLVGLLLQPLAVVSQETAPWNERLAVWAVNEYFGALCVQVLLHVRNLQTEIAVLTFGIDGFADLKVLFPESSIYHLLAIDALDEVLWTRHVKVLASLLQGRVLEATAERTVGRLTKTALDVLLELGECDGVAFQRAVLLLALANHLVSLC